jgi:hypothetical protein
MAAEYDATEFIDGDFQRGPSHLRAPTREEVDSKVAQAHQELVEKRRELEECERKRAALEETRRRQVEFETGRQEMIHNLTRGVGLLEEAELNARRDAEQMARILGNFREALSKVQAIQEAAWTKDNLEIELTRALTTVENARMEWNSARLKLPILSGSVPLNTPDNAPAENFSWSTMSLGQLCRLGLALTWPVATVLLLGLGAVLVVLLRR